MILPKPKPPCLDCRFLVIINAQTFFGKASSKNNSGVSLSMQNDTRLFIYFDISYYSLQAF